MCQSTANIVKISPKLRFLDDHNSKNTRLMWLKFGVAKLLCICIDLTKFEGNPEGLSFFCVDLTWNDPIATFLAEKKKAMYSLLGPVLLLACCLYTQCIFYLMHTKEPQTGCSVQIIDTGTQVTPSPILTDFS